MLVLSRKLNEKIVIDGGIVVTVVKIDRNQVRLGIEAPGDVRIYREEIAAAVSSASSEGRLALVSESIRGIRIWRCRASESRCELSQTSGTARWVPARPQSLQKGSRRHTPGAISTGHGVVAQSAAKTNENEGSCSTACAMWSTVFGVICFPFRAGRDAIALPCVPFGERRIRS